MAAILEKRKTLIQTVEEEKNELAIKLLSLKDKSMVHINKLIVDDLTSTVAKKTTKAQYNKEIDAAVKRVRNGKSVDTKKMVKQQ